jgi:transposase-like protein
MAQYNFTLEEELVKALFLNGCESEGLKGVLEAILTQILEARANDMCGAALYEQSEDRVDYRNGYRDHSLTTRIGKIEIQMPRLRGQSLLTGGLFETYRKSEQALMAGIAEMVVKGVSTRKINDIAQILFGTSISKSQVSRICELLAPVVEEFRSRPLDEWIPFVIVDAMYLKVREGTRVLSKALYIAIGINIQGKREILGFMLSDTETKDQYVGFFRSMKKRGLSRVDLVVSDAHAGLMEAVREVFVGASWQRCQTHFSRNMKDATPKKVWPEVKAMLQEIYTAKDKTTARARKDEAMEFLLQNAPKAADLLDDAFDDIIAVLSLPMKYRTNLRTSNTIERLNEEVRRRERVIRIFPTESSVMRILGTLLIEEHEKWAAGKRCFDMIEYHEHVRSAALDTAEERRRDVAA